VRAAQKQFGTRVMIEGKVLNGGGGVAGVTMRGLETACMASDSNGRYDCFFPSGWSGELVPAWRSGSFAPERRAYQGITRNQHGQDFSLR
jgi:hypothetical protein